LTDTSCPRVCLVIAALNEAETIASVVAEAASYGLPVVVDDGSSDGTGALALEAGAVVVTHRVNRGYDDALASGFARAVELGAEYVITLDADGQHDATTLGSFVAELDRGADLVVGTRDRHQRIAEMIFSWVGRLAWQIDDPLCGLKGYRVSVYRELGHFCSYRSIGTELTIFAARQGKRIVQVPVGTRDRVGETRFGGGLDANWRILRALFLGIVRSSGRAHHPVK
jgi:glycosyltransferase involved in cell wall biosynthesis